MGIFSLTDSQLEQFNKQGFIVLEQMADSATLQAMLDAVQQALNPPLGPLEYEAELNYPGAPDNLAAAGGRTPRRLLHAYSRDEIFRAWAGREDIVKIVSRLLGSEQPCLTQSHHNCVMTKHPNYGSETGWHQDIRYWQFEDTNLINVWLALGHEYAGNGGMQVIPGSHHVDFETDCFEEALFFRTDIEKNQPWLEQAISVELNAGDILIFHACILHAAGKNLSNEVKQSLVFTYHDVNNHPLESTRSSRFDSIPFFQAE